MFPRLDPRGHHTLCTPPLHATVWLSFLPKIMSCALFSEYWRCNTNWFVTICKNLYFMHLLLFSYQDCSGQTPVWFTLIDLILFSLIIFIGINLVNGYANYDGRCNYDGRGQRQPQSGTTEEAMGRHDKARHEVSPIKEKTYWWSKEVERRDQSGWPLLLGGVIQTGRRYIYITWSTVMQIMLRLSEQTCMWSAAGL